MIKLYIYCSAFIIGHLQVGQYVGMKFHQAVMEIVSHDISFGRIRHNLTTNEFPKKANDWFVGVFTGGFSKFKIFKLTGSNLIC